MIDALNAILEEANSPYRVSEGDPVTRHLVGVILDAAVVICTKRVLEEIKKDDNQNHETR